MSAAARAKAHNSISIGSALALFSIFLVSAVSPPAPAAAADGISGAIKRYITGGTAKTGGEPAHNRTTRFEILVPEKVMFEVQALQAPTNRVVVEFPATRFVLPNPPLTKKRGSLVKSFVGGRSGPNRSRVVINVAEPVVVKKQEIIKSDRGHSHYIALELVPAATVTKSAQGGSETFSVQRSGLGAVGLQPPLPKPAVRPQERIAKAYRPVVVIDPGHGGHDSGARKYGTVEKNVVLAFSKVLREQLKATGRYRVLMTRDTDVFISLDGRREFAEKHGAQLFIAVHADYARRTSARGATIYSLRKGVANRLRKEAKGEVRSEVLTSNELRSVMRADNDSQVIRKILMDLAARELDLTRSRTNFFSRTVIANMGSATSMRGTPHRSAAFRVLKTAKVPSVLIELAYVSNRRDARNLKSRRWRQKVAVSIRQAVDNYFSQARDPRALGTAGK